MPRNSSKRKRRHSQKFKLLFDENMPLPKKMPRLNSRFLVKHTVEDYNKAGAKDIEVYELAKRENRIIVTFNVKHFRELATLSKNSGVIGLSPNLSTEQIDKKLAALLLRSAASQIFGKFNYISS